MLKQIFCLLPKKQTVKIFTKIASYFNPKYFFSRLTKLSLVIGLLAYLMGYQPVLAIPPLKKSVVLAEFSQEQTITSGNLSQPFQLPHPGYLSNRYALWHQAVDIAVGLGAPVHPINNGKVIEVSFDLWGLGRFIVVEHEQGYKSLYAHLGRVFVSKGGQVTTNSILGEVGLTGRTSGPHTHLEITKDGKIINPEAVLPSIPLWNTFQSSK